MARTHSEIGRSNVRRSKSHERRVAKLLTKWSNITFRRRRVEGRDFATVANDSTADVIAVGTNFRFSVEAKCGQGFSLDAMLGSPKTSKFSEWWFQTCWDAELLTKHRSIDIYPMLFFKPEPSFDWLAISAKVLPILQDKKGMSYDELWFSHFKFNIYDNIEITGNISHSKKNKVLQTMKLHPVIICRWKEFNSNINATNLFYDS